MKLKLIVPVAVKQKRWTKYFAIPPLNLLYVAALTPKDVEITLIDEHIDRIDFEEAVDLVGITSLTATAPRAYEIGDEFKKRGVKVVLGGIHPSTLPEEAIQHADSIVIGEAENLWPEVIEDFKKKRLKKFYQSSQKPSLKNLLLPRRDLLQGKRYLTKNFIQTTRGCPFDCDFCSVTKFFGRRHRFRPVEDVVKEIESLEGNFTIFADDNVVAHKKYAKELFKALIPCKKRWFSQADLSMAQDEELLKLAAQSGCEGVYIGFESLSDIGLKKFKKYINFKDAINRLKKHGIRVEGSFIFGFDSDDKRVFEKTLRFAQELRLDVATFHLLTPLPGTQLYEKLERENRIVVRDWSKYNLSTVVFQPKQMTREELQEGVRWTMKKFYSLFSMTKRLFPPPFKTLPHIIAYNLSRKAHFLKSLKK
ncbi:B12-binding domain-containing radical SAM protein [bacterium]|nr:B12-binding domain-containing radical SAM protein [bacterium]